MTTLLETLLQGGWKDSNHRFADYMILINGNERMLYDKDKQRIVSGYRVKEIQDTKPLHVGSLL